jgi:hypothetical protein
MNWGNSIVLSFVLFAVFIGTLVSVCMKQEINLVAPDYYKQELNYQKQIERLHNASQLLMKPDISISNSMLLVAFDQFNRIESGELKLIRPSNPEFDNSFILQATADSIQQFDLSNQPSGMYKAKMTWAMNGKEFFFEKIIYR